MKMRSFILAALALALPLAGAKAITFTNNTAIGVGNTTYDGQDIIVSGCTLTVDGPHAFASLLVTNSGAVTHSPAPNGETNNRLNLTILGDLSVSGDSRIDVNGRGFITGQGPGQGGSCGSTGGGGGGHGGQGGSGSGCGGGSAYGSLTQPTSWGSGGGRHYYGGVAGAGGGAVRLNVAGVLTVDGQLSAQGTDGQSNGSFGTGGGSGGSIYLTVGTLAGAGVISANGGSAPVPGGGGGGGRIAILCGTETFTGTQCAYGGTGLVRGGAGTVYTKTVAETVGRVRLDNGGASGAMTPVSSSEAFSLTLSNGAQAYPSESLTLGGLSVMTNGLLTYLDQQVGIELTVLGDAVIGLGGRISADGKGYGTGQGTGAGGNCGTTGGGGGGHGGQGGSGSGCGGGSAYGSLTQPTIWGSGGGRCEYVATAGSGGGAVRLSVTGVLTVDGQLSAQGTAGLQNGSYGTGGGSGGSIYLTAGTLAGAGVISANGGSGPVPGGGGSGGRIAIYCGAETFTGTQCAYGGTGLVRGGAGTIYTKTAAETVGRVRLDNGGASGALTPVSSPEAFSLTLSNGAQAYPSESLTLGGLSVMTNGLLTYLNQQVGGDLTVLGDAVIGPGGRLSADGKGYGTGRGAGAGGNCGTTGGGGGGHGGYGGSGFGCGGGSTYGLLTQPTAWGSGGGRCEYVATAGSGGGAVRLSVAGVLTVDGHLSAKGTDGAVNGSYGTGGGSGGSIYLTVGTLAGAGVIAANGGSGPVPGGGGGGGRIAIYRHTVAGPVTVSIGAYGGSGYQVGGFGSIYLATNMLPLEVSAFSPTGTLRQSVSSVDIAFNQPVRRETFTPEDVLITAPSGQMPSGDITVTPLSAASYRIGFGSQAAVGTYLVQVGPHIENLYGQEMAEAYVGSFAITNPIISGFVKRTNGVALPNVLLSAGGALSTATDTNGSYALTVPPSWSGTLPPSLAGWVFTPPSLSYVSLTADATNQNFTANLAEAMVLTTTASGSALNFRWPSAVGLSYQLQSATNLPVTTWLNEGLPFPGTGGVLTTNFSLGPEPSKFFRLRLLDD